MVLYKCWNSSFLFLACPDPLTDLSEPKKLFYVRHRHIDFDLLFGEISAILPQSFNSQLELETCTNI